MPLDTQSTRRAALDRESGTNRGLDRSTDLLTSKATAWKAVCQ